MVSSYYCCDDVVTSLVYCDEPQVQNGGYTSCHISSTRYEHDCCEYHTKIRTCAGIRLMSLQPVKKQE